MKILDMDALPIKPNSIKYALTIFGDDGTDNEVFIKAQILFALYELVILKEVL